MADAKCGDIPGMMAMCCVPSPFIPPMQRQTTRQACIPSGKAWRASWGTARAALCLSVVQALGEEGVRDRDGARAPCLGRPQRNRCPEAGAAAHWGDAGGRRRAWPQRRHHRCAPSLSIWRPAAKHGPTATNPSPPQSFGKVLTGKLCNGTTRHGGRVTSGASMVVPPFSIH
jgi:hypothetical protein